MNFNNLSKKKKSSGKLRPDFCPEINIDMKYDYY